MKTASVHDTVSHLDVDQILTESILRNRMNLGKINLNCNSFMAWPRAFDNSCVEISNVCEIQIKV